MRVGAHIRGSKRVSTLLVSLLSMVLLLSACSGGGNSGGNAAPKPAEGGTTPPPAAAKKTIKVGTPADVTNVDPHLATDLYSGMAFAQIFEPLLQVDLSGKTVPSLATEWKVADDNVTWTFTIRQNVKFHDGTPMTVEDVKYSLERILDQAIASPRRGQFAATIDSVAVEGTDKVIVKLKAPNAGFLASLGNAYVVPKAIASTGKDALTAKPIGTGPFKFVERKADEHFTMAVNPDYWGGKANIDEIILRPIPDANTRTVELETGGVDLIPTLAAADVERVTKNEKLRVESSVGSNYRFIFFNLEKPPFDNKNLRLAVAHAINKDQIIKTIYPGVAERAEGPIPPVSFAYDKAFKGIPYDVEKAKKLVQESGVANPTIEYLISTGDQNTREAQLIQAMLTQIGFKVNIRTVEFGTFLEEAKKGNFNMARVGWTVAPEPNELLYSRYHTGTPEGFNWSRFSNSAVDKLLEDGIKEQDPAKRAKIYQDAQRLIVDEAPEFHIFHEARLYGVNKRVEGFKGHFGGSIYFKAPALGIDVTVK